jgi:hypothetical protein
MSRHGLVVEKVWARTFMKDVAKRIVGSQSRLTNT